MNHDQEFLDKEELVRLDYANCLLYLRTFFENAPGESNYFCTEGMIERGFLYHEAQDKIKAMVERKLIRPISTHYQLYTITPRGSKKISKLLKDQPEIMG